MPDGKAIDRTCLICSITCRSDHLKRHVQSIHSKQSVPEGWIVFADKPIWMQQKRVKLNVQSDHPTVESNGKLFARYLVGICLSCGSSICNTDEDGKPFTDNRGFRNHICRAKQVRDRTVSTPKPTKETVKPVRVKEPAKPVPDDDGWQTPATDLPELYEAILDRISQRPTLSLKPKQEVLAVLEGLQGDPDYEGDYNMMIQMSFTTICDKLEERDKKILEMQQQLRRLDQENWKLKSQIPDSQDELTLVIKD